jgi:hypothetical protein
MPHATHAPQSSAPFVTHLIRLILAPIAHMLRTGDPHATVDRLFSSRHVKDLRLIIATSLGLFYVVFLIAIALSVAKQIAHPHLISFGFTEFGKVLALFGPVIAVIGAVLAWAYQVGSARLGVVDLFACEISTLCKVATIVDAVRKRVDAFYHGPPSEPAGKQDAPTQQFTSQEDYFPVFESCTRDLQTLGANVVVNITAFYTYMKAVRDSMRTLLEITPQPAELGPPSGTGPVTGPWHDAACNVVYMLFLGMESARIAIRDLVEFDPEREERTIVILISELEAYQFLCIQFPEEHEMHHERIVLRDPAYRHLVPELCRSVQAGKDLEKSGKDARESGRIPLWEPAWRLLPELNKRYLAAIEVHREP